MAEKEQNFLQELGQRIARLRKAQSLTQARLAELLQISQQLVAFYEQGHRRVPIDVLPELARILGVPVEELLGNTNGSAKRGPTPLLQRQLEQLSRLPRAKQRVVNEILTGILQQANR